MIASFHALALVAALAGQAPADEPYGRHQFDRSQREHWAFLPIAQPPIPTVQDNSWITNEIDSFVLARLEAAGLRPAPPAERGTLLRRVYLDLIGLLPTPDEQAAFSADQSADALSRVIDDLLSRPQYGERWGRHWLDVARYAESNGYERDNPKPHAWRYRDYVIAAFNEDKPFDRFVLEQIAGDEIEGSNAQMQIATTFLRLGPWDDEPADPLIDRYDQLDDVLAATAAAFMAQTIRCARCHDHKLEPFTQRDYARLLAVFEPLQRPRNDRDDLDRFVGNEAELTAFGTAQAEFDRQEGEIEKEARLLELDVSRRLTAASTGDLPAEALAAFQVEPAERTKEQKKLVEDSRDKLREVIRAAATDDERARLASCDERQKTVNAARPAPLPKAYIWFEDGPTAPATHVFHRGNPAEPLEEVYPGFPAVLVDAPPPAATPTAHGTGRRRQLAEWLVGPTNPLTARVIVNRVWQHHFGDGIVGTENDFGVMGQGPTHPELLDWLAADFIAGGWRIKRLHRQIMLSSGYRMSAIASEPGEKRDPDNDLLWRFRPRRLEAEAIRDSILAASGQLNPAAGGPSVFPKISQAVLAGQSRPGSGWGTSDAAQAARRSIYVFAKRTLVVPELEVLDLPSSNETCEQRAVSTVAPQALTLFNGEFLHEQSRHFADRLATESGDSPAAQIERAYRLALCRPPTEAERTLAIDFLIRQRDQIAAETKAAGQPAPDADRRALASLCLVLLNTNEFAYLR